ncbi:MAG: translation initiation factor IF-2 N-terminal domain-containing protein, partial [Oscillospiraceae bacterium]|nr:translation initiation factor IF-2 N-terminal domain-containing protein [Oscillospiraceae bacterium]
MTVKYKLSDVAKDLNLTSKEVADLLASRMGGEPKKAGATLNEAELNLIFEHYTHQHEVASFDSYFASRDQKPAPKAAPAEKKAAPAPKKAAAPAAEKPAEKAAPAPAAEKPAEKAAPALAAEKPAEKAAPAPAAEKPAEKAAPAPAA